MRFSLLGPLIVADDAGSQITLDGSRLRVLLAVLLLHANMPVSADKVAEMVWDGSPSPGAIATLRSYIRRLRRALDPESTRIAARGPGYLIHVDQAELDVLEFETLCRETRAARMADEWVDAWATATRALRLWRSAPLLDVPSEALRVEFVPRLERLRLEILEYRFDAGLRLGHHQELISELTDLTAKHPLRERFHAQLMLALAGSGRRAQALHAYQEARNALVEELGMEPGLELRAIHQQILANDSAGAGERADDTRPGAIGGENRTGVIAAFADAPAAATESAGRAGKAASMQPAPAQLPADIADFTGREVQVTILCEALTSNAAADSPGLARVVVVAGIAGLGKTTLAVHAAHRVRDQFPDGQLFADLRGTSAEPTAPAEVLARFLRDLGVEGEKIPVGDEEARAALYRTWLTGQRVLIVLDNAQDLAQIRPLLPGTASCAVLVTTRSCTFQVVSTRFIDLETLSGPEAEKLFSQIVGRDRTATEPGATMEILDACAGLPLAIRICGARLATRRRWQIGTMANRLRDERRRLDELQVADLEIRASFRVSYDNLAVGRCRGDPPRAFRLLGCWQGPQLALAAAAALLGEKAADAAAALETLVDANLLECRGPDCYQFHELLRLFAKERAQEEEPEEERLEAVTRLLGWYLETAEACADILSPYRYRIPPDKPRAPHPMLNSTEDALSWYDSEQVNLMFAIRQAASAGLHDLAWRLATALLPPFSRRENWADCVTAHLIAVDSARMAGHRQGEAWALQNLGYGLGRVGAAEAFDYLEKALAIRQEMQDVVGEAQTALALVDVRYRLQGPEAAFDDSLRYLETARRAGNPSLLGVALNNHGEISRALGRLDEATEYLQEALDIFTDIGGYGRGYVLETMGHIHLESGRLTEAIASLTEANRAHITSGQLMGQALSLKRLGQAQRGVGQGERARESLAAALVLFEKLRAEEEAEAVRSALTAEDNPGKPSAHFPAEGRR